MTDDKPRGTEENRSDRNAAHGQILPVWGRLLFVLATLIPIWRLAHLIHRYAIPVPFMDEWALAPIMVDTHNHALTFRELWTQHNEHRMLFPYLMFLGLAQFGGWNVTRECWASLIVTICSFCLIADLARRTVGSRMAYPLCLVYAWLFFSPMQWENFIIGFQLQWPLTVFALVLCIWSLTVWRGRLRGLVCAAVGATLASYSMAGGLMVWIIGLTYLLLTTGDPRWTRAHRIAWVLAASVCFAAFMYRSDWGPSKVGHDYWRHHLVVLANYITYYIGSPVLFIKSKLTSMVGITGIAAYGYFGFVWLRRRTRVVDTASNGTLTWLMIGAFGLLDAVSTGLGRCSYGAEQAGTSRYLTIANTLWIGAIGAACTLFVSPNRSRLWKPVPIRTGLAVVFAACGFVFFHWSVANGYIQVAERTRICRRGVASLPHYKTAPDADLLRLYPDPAALRQMCAVLDRNHIWPFDHS